MTKLSFDIGNEVHHEGVWDDDEYYFLKYFVLRNVSKYIFLKIYYWYKHVKIIKKYKKINLKTQNSKNFKKYG